MSSLKTLDGPKVELICTCRTCRIKHHVQLNPGTDIFREMDEWYCKHPAPLHKTEFITPKRDIPYDLDDSDFEQSGIGPWWLDFKDNANIKVAYASSTAITITLAALATSSTLLVGRASTVVDNTSNLYLDYSIGGFVTTGTSPTASKEIDIYLYGSSDDTPTYPCGGTIGTNITGSDAAFTFATSDIQNSGLKLLSVIATSATSNEQSSVSPTSVASLFGGYVPWKWGVFLTHNTAVNLHATAGNHAFTFKPLYATSV